MCFFFTIILVGCYRGFIKTREFIKAFVLIIVTDDGLLDSYPGIHISLKVNTSTLRDPVLCFPPHTVSQMKQIWNASNYIYLCIDTYTHSLTSPHQVSLLCSTAAPRQFQKRSKLVELVAVWTKLWEMAPVQVLDKILQYRPRKNSCIDLLKLKVMARTRTRHVTGRHEMRCPHLQAHWALLDPAAV